MTNAHRPRRSPNRLTAWHLLLLVPVVAVLWVPFFNSVEPRIFGFPFFYAYQLAWVILGSVVIGIVYLATRSDHAP